MKKLTSQEIEVFNENYIKNLFVFMKNNQLFLLEHKNVNKYTPDNRSRYMVVQSINQLINQGSYNIIDKEKLISIYEQGELNWVHGLNALETNFFLEQYDMLPQLDKDILLSITTLSLKKMSEQLNKKPERIIELINLTGLTKISKTNTRHFSLMLNELYKTWHDTLDRESFNLVSKTLFVNAKKSFKNEKVNVAFKYILSKYVHDKEEELKLLFPDIENSASSLFVEEQLNSFSFSVDKDKLKKFVFLKELKHYDKMHEDLLYLLNVKEIKNSLNIKTVETATTDKKEYNFTVLYSNDNAIDKEDFKNLLVKLYKAYSDLYLQNNYISKFTDLTVQWFNHFYLTEKLAEKNNNITPRKKI